MSQPSIEPSGILSGLPENYIMRDFSGMKALITDVRAILDKLNKDEDNGNQYLLILSLPTAIRMELDTSKSALDGIPFRFVFDGPSALVKVIPSFAHDASTRRLTENILLNCLMVCVSREQTCWASTTTYRATTNNMGKQPDDCFLPLSRQPHDLQQPLNWPTLFIESGVSESLPKLREDSRWWFENSSGLVHTVIVLGIQKACKSIQLEKWQLMDPSLSTSSIINATLSIPFLVQQDAASQHVYAAQTITITPTAVAGDVLLVLHFQCLLDRPPMGTERDIVLNIPTLMDIARFVV